MKAQRFRSAKALALSFALATAYGCEKEHGPPKAEPLRPVRVETVVASGSGTTRTFSGRTRADSETKLSFKVGGTVTEVKPKVGDKIKEGQTVATLEARDQSLQVQGAQASVQQVRAQLTNAKAQYARIKALYENSNATASDLDSARTAVASAEAALKAAGKQVELAQAQAGKTVLKSPLAGVVASVSVEAGENVSPGQPVLLLTSGGAAEVEIAVPETVISRVKMGMLATVRIDALGGKPFDAKVSEVGVTPGQTATTYAVIARLLEQNADVRPGMAAQVALNFGNGKASNVVHVAAKAVGEDRGGRFVFVAKPQGEGLAVVKRKQVEVGSIGTAGIEIKRGLEPGELLVTAGVTHLVDGKQVKLPQNAVPPPAVARSGSAAPSSDPAPPVPSTKGK
jgi:RND family efflux transporter MFP subunit